MKEKVNLAIGLNEKMMQMAKNKISDFGFFSLADTILYLTREYVDYLDINNKYRVSKASINIFNSIQVKHYGACWKFLFVGRVAPEFVLRLKNIANTLGYKTYNELIRTIVYAFVECDAETTACLLSEINKLKANRFGVPILHKRVISIHGLISDHDYKTIKKMADNAGLPVSGLYNSCIDMILQIEYQENDDLANSFMGKALITELEAPGLFKNHFHLDKYVSVYTCKLERYARILCIMEKYNIAYKVDLFDRLTKFLLKMRGAPISYIKVFDNDDSSDEYQFDRLVKKDFVRSIYR